MNSSINDLLILFTFLDRLSKLKILFNLILSVLNSFLESLSLSSALIFFNILFTGNIRDISFINKYFPFIVDLPTFIFLIFFVVIFSLTGLIRIYYIKNTFYLSRILVNYLSSQAFLKILNQKYEFHLGNNSSFLVSTLTNDVGESVNSITALLQIISSTLSLFSILITIIFFIYSKSIIFILIIPIIYFLLYRVYADKFSKNSRLISDLNAKEIELVKDSLFSIRNILLSHNQEYYFNKFKKIDRNLKEAQALNNFYSVFPRNAIEILIIAALSTLFIVYPKFTEPENLPIFGALIFALQRIFPLFQLIYYGYSSIKSRDASVSKLIELLSLISQKKIMPSKNILKFNSISFIDVTYVYPNTSKKVLNNISLTINKGDKIGLYGASGSGKSTFINLLMTLLVPNNGHIKVNNKFLDPKSDSPNYSNYQDIISHIPQSIHLIDGDILANILGPDTFEIDERKLKLALKVSYLDGFISSLPKKINTNVGENGSLLSGGQRQRIGIAREIYKMKQILVLDEATNALDPALEKLIINELFKLDYLKLIIIISHKKSNLFRCNRIFKINKGQIIVQD